VAAEAFIIIAGAVNVGSRCELLAAIANVKVTVTNKKISVSA